MKILVFVMLCLSFNVFSVTSTEVFNNDSLIKELDTVRRYNSLRNEINGILPTLDKEDVIKLKDYTTSLIKDMENYPHLFKKEDLDSATEFRDQLANSIFLADEIEKCDVDPQYDLTKNDLAVFTNNAILGQIDEQARCKNLEKSSYAFPELGSIKDLGIKVVQSSMATEINHALLDDHIRNYFASLQKYGTKSGNLPNLKALRGRVCNGESKYCEEKLNDAYAKMSEKKESFAYRDLTNKDKQNIVFGVNAQVAKLNSMVNNLREITKKNGSLMTIGGNDFLFECNNPDSEANKLYEQYQAEVEKLISPKSHSVKDVMTSELVVTMLYDDIGQPVVPETECNEEGFKEVTLNKKQHDYIDVDDLDSAASDVVKNAEKMIELEVNDFDENDDPIDYIGQKVAFAPHVVGPMLAKNPETVSLVCDGLKDYQFDEKVKDYTNKTVMVLTAVTAVTGIGGLAFAGLRAALWAGGRVLGREAIRAISKTGVTRFSKRAANKLLNSNGAILSYGAVTVGEVATLQYLRKDKQNQILALQNKVLAMEDSDAKEKLWHELNKMAELDFDYYLSLGFGLFDVAAVGGMLKLDAFVSNKQALELADYLKAKRVKMDKLKNDPSYRTLKSMELVLPKDVYQRLVSTLVNHDLNADEIKNFSVNLKLNLETEKDFSKALDKTIAESKINLDLPSETELNRRILEEIPESQKAELIVSLTSEYSDVIKQKGFDSPEYKEDMASILYLLEKKEFKNRNLPIDEKKEIMAKKLDDLVSKSCGK